MTNRNPDYHCGVCGRYMHSSFAHEALYPLPQLCRTCANTKPTPKVTTKTKTETQPKAEEPTMPNLLPSDGYAIDRLEDIPNEKCFVIVTFADFRNAEGDYCSHAVMRVYRTEDSLKEGVRRMIVGPTSGRNPYKVLAINPVQVTAEINIKVEQEQ